MSIKFSALIATSLLVAASAVSTASAQPTMVKKFADWGVYSYQNGGHKSCYVLTIPQQMQPASVNHGDNFFLVAPKPSARGDYFPQAIMGYDLKNGSQMTLKIGNESFVLRSEGNAGWTRQEDREAALIAAMRSGSAMTLEAVSGRGTQTSYTFSLSGITAALRQAESCS